MMRLMRFHGKGNGEKLSLYFLWTVQIGDSNLLLAIFSKILYTSNRLMKGKIIDCFKNCVLTAFDGAGAVLVPPPPHCSKKYILRLLWRFYNLIKFQTQVYYRDGLYSRLSFIHK